MFYIVSIQITLDPIDPDELYNQIFKKKDDEIIKHNKALSRTHS